MADLIDRQAALDALRTCYDTENITYSNGNEYIDYNQANDLIKDLPSEPDQISLESAIDYLRGIGWMQEHDRAWAKFAQQGRITGRWIEKYGDKTVRYCDQCGAVLEGDELNWRNNYFCYHCGADMREEQPMSDLIDRQAAINAIARASILGSEEAIREFYDRRESDDFLDGILTAIEEIHNLPSAEPQQRWIPVSEKLPKEGQVVLWTNGVGGVFTSAIIFQRNDNWLIGRRHWGSRAIAWMPLPEPYQDEEI